MLPLVSNIICVPGAKPAAALSRPCKPAGWRVGPAAVSASLLHQSTRSSLPGQHAPSPCPTAGRQVPGPKAAGNRSARQGVVLSAAMRPAVVSPAAVEIPESREEAISQAVQALNAGVEAASGLRPGRKSRKSKAPGRQGNRLSVEVPVADESPVSTVALVKDLVTGLFKKGEVEELTVVFADFETAKVALKSEFPRGVDVDYLEEAAAVGVKQSIMVVSPGEAEAADLDALMTNWNGQFAILLNPGWNPFSPPMGYDDLAASFVTVYSFVPIAMKVFVSTVEGAIFKRVVKGDPGDAPWQIFQMQGGAFVPIGRQNQRPTNENIEVAFANASAASSPLKKLFGGKKK